MNALVRSTQQTAESGKGQAKNTPASSSGSARASLRTIQQTAGNMAMQRLYAIQAKLHVSQPDDSYEKEADRIAGEVMSDHGASRRPISSISSINHSDSDSHQVSKKSHNSGHQAAESASSLISNPGTGRSMPDHVRMRLEHKLGVDFGHVRVHQDSHAQDAAQTLQAKAFTHGHHIWLGAGESADDVPLMAHEATHVVQQGAAKGSGIVQTKPVHGVVQRYTTPNPTATAPPPAGAVPPAGSFAPLSSAELADRQRHGMSTDTGQMIKEIEGTVFVTGGAHPACTPVPTFFPDMIAPMVGWQLLIDMPSLTPATAPDPMGIAQASAEEAMPIIHNHYSPHAPSRSASAFMAHVRRKSPTYGNPIRNNPLMLGEFLSWYAGARTNLRNLIASTCVDRTFWDAFARWIMGTRFSTAFLPVLNAGNMIATPDFYVRGDGSAWDGSPFNIRERSALFDTYNTSVTQGGTIQFGLGFELWNIPHTVDHEAMHLFQHPEFEAQVGRLQNIRQSTDIFTEGFAEYLARGVREPVVDALQNRSPPELSPADAVRAKRAQAYEYYFDKTVEIRNMLYSHGQDGEESIRRAFFLGEGWRFGLLEAGGVGSPVETDRPIPSVTDVHFNTGHSTPLDPGRLGAIIAYVTTRSVATIRIVGRTDPQGGDADNLVLGQQRADGVKSYLVSQGIAPTRITTDSRGEMDQISGGWARNRRATVTVIDPRNLFPGTGRP